MAFSYEHFPSLLDSAYLPSSPLDMPLPPQHAGGDLNNASYCFPYYYPPETLMAELSGTGAKNYDSSSSLDSAANAPSVDSSTCHSPKSGDDEKRNSKHQASAEKKRRSKYEISFTSGQSKITKGSKQDKAMAGLKEKESKKPKANDMKESGEPPAGYIHVRARRGQATDSHSLAERVRREKISERMKMLQGLVPGCDRVTGKAHMLDEIINYVQSLQNQVEFLSMRLASLSPMVYGFGLDISDYTTTNPPEKMTRRTPQSAMPTAEQRAVQLESTTTFENATSATTNYHMMDNSPYLLQGQVPTSSFHQDAGSSVMQVGAVRKVLPNQIEFVNITSLL